jgi:phage gpG-like protein
MPIVVNEREVLAGLGRLLAAGENPRPWLSAIGNAGVDETRLRFSESRAPDGSAWAPLSPVTIALRRGSSAQPLLDTGALRNSITSVVDDKSVTIGTNKVQAPMLHFGARRGQFGRGQYRTRRGSFPIPWGDVPARPIFGVSREFKSEIVTILATALGGEK